MEPQISKIQISEDFVVYQGAKIGQGAFAIILKGYSKKRECQVAIKQFHSNIQRQWRINKENRQRYQREIAILKKTKHPNILQFYEFIDSKEGIFLVTELCNQGNLASKISILDQATTFKYLCQIVKGMAYLNNQGYLHRDLKPQNILLQNDVIKIADFGLARGMLGDDIKKSRQYTPVKGTFYYMAPNVLNSGQYNNKCDVWSLGCILYEILKKNKLFAQQSIAEVIKAHKVYQKKKFVLEGNYHRFFKEFLPRMIQYYQQQRIDFNQLNNYLTKNQIQIMSEMTNIKPEYLVKQMQPELQQIVQCYKEQQINRIFEQICQYSQFFNQIQQLYKSLNENIKTMDWQEFYKNVIKYQLTGVFIHKLSDAIKNLLESKSIVLLNYFNIERNRISEESQQIINLSQVANELKKKRQVFQKIAKDLTRKFFNDNSSIKANFKNKSKNKGFLSKIQTNYTKTLEWYPQFENKLRDHLLNDLYDLYPPKKPDYLRNYAHAIYLSQLNPSSQINDLVKYYEENIKLAPIEFVQNYLMQQKKKNI